jgi:radical SAM superfamily enzyme YgiQ (UPF0313 family)
VKLLLVNPGEAGACEMPPFNLMILASYIRSKGHEVQICNMEDNEWLPNFLTQFKPEVVGFTGMTPTIPKTYAAAKRARSQGFFTVIGGVHASVFPSQSLAYADAVVKGEGETALLDIMTSRRRGVVEGEVFKNLDELPMPAWDLINTESYCLLPRRASMSILSYVPYNHRVLSVMHSRGCPFRCTFCYNSTRPSPVRTMSPERVVGEVKHLVDTYKLDTIHFHDDDFMLNTKRVERICSLLRENKVKIYWSANARATDITQEKLDLAKAHGCVQLAFGFESGSDRILEVLQKKQTVESIKKAITLCDNNGIITQGSFMFNNPTETLEEMAQTAQLAEDYNIDGGLGAQSTIPFPGTLLWDWCLERRVFGKSVSCESFNYMDVTYKISDVPLDKMKEYIPKIRKRFCELFDARQESRLRKVQEMVKKIREGKVLG